MKKRYEYGDTKVIESYAKSIRDNGLNQQQKQIYQFFSFRLASVRNLYMSKFLKEHDSIKADIKEQLAMLFGKAHLDSMQEDYTSLANTLSDIDKLDEQYRTLCIHDKGESCLWIKYKKQK